MVLFLFSENADFDEKKKKGKGTHTHTKKNSIEKCRKHFKWILPNTIKGLTKSANVTSIFEWKGVIYL